MNISDRSVITTSDKPNVQPGRTQAIGQGRQRARTFADESQEQRQRTTTPAAADAANLQAQAVIPVGEVYSSGRRAEYYQIEDISRFTSTQRKALRLYSSNQGLSQLDANVDYLGAVDTFA